MPDQPVICEFVDEYFFLSNFYLKAFTVGESQLPDFIDIPITFTSSEHYYQAMKATNADDFMRVVGCETPGQCKRAGQKIELRPDWDSVKLEVMRDALRYKFPDFPTGLTKRFVELSSQLVCTNPALLIEGNNWGDHYWGSDQADFSVGKNWLGHLLMARRAELLSQVGVGG